MDYYYRTNIENYQPCFPGHCGTVMCIGGYLEEHFPDIFYEDKVEYRKLFHPVNIEYATATPEQAIKAIEVFIKSDGKFAWSAE